MNKVLSSPIKQVSNKINAGEIQPTELCKSALKLISLTRPLNAYINVCEDLAQKQASESDKRQQDNKLLGSLDGIPVAIKDNFCVENYPTTCASFMLANFVPGYSATVYNNLKKHGAVLLGKTNLDQFAMGAGTVDSYYGPTQNLWGSNLMENFVSDSIDSIPVVKKADKNHWNIAGGSSGGSAVAVATGTCFAGIGSDTGGSTRNPAAYCGLIGLKPSYGLVSRHGLIPLVNSMDVPGILTRNVDDCLLILNAIAGTDQLDSTTLDQSLTPIEISSTDINVRGLRVGIPNEYNHAELNQEVHNTWMGVSNLLKEAGAEVVPVSLPHTEYSIVCYSVLNQCEVASNMARYDGIEYGLRADESMSTERLYAKTRSLGFNNVVRSRILTGNYFLLSENYDDYFVKAMKARRLIAQDFDAVWNDNIDILLTPTTLSDAPIYKDFISQDNQTQCSVQDYCTQPANMAGIPAINVPISLSNKGLPLSLQLMAPFLHEQRLLTVAKWLEDAVKFPRIYLKESCL
ncbi:glutamyl-tRNA(Gln) amidotransferase subunit A, mitochondrial isoform X1 [Cotesia glomerata]|uniref:Glutamyl-tRNA(Gln) amidotransferase subunit A, mitochondrial n=2 Tax=Cotesia glomerata TaxID=32391 RepID=A0AAV7J713_COTGL|nr:glutamyl-tRNA(Gln) amidotransferase subunit A, mitochondrial isoform X1 [Cotesia glomerata]KAH0566982.1 hypothetical protein KQX54_005871 [Cotesia glomerata]